MVVDQELIVDVVIPFWNRRGLISECLESVISSEFPAGYRLGEIVAVDDGSSDDGAEVAAEFSGISLLRCQQNCGVAKARNIGSRVGSGQVIVFVDSDNEVSVDCLYQLAKTLKEHPQIGLVGPLMLRDLDGKVWLSKARISFWTGLSEYEGTGEEPERYLSDFCIVDGGHVPNLFAVRRDAFEECGRFYEPYFIMFEESDLAARLEKNGYKIAMNYTAKTLHRHVVASGNRQEDRDRNYTREYLIAKNRQIFISRNSNRIQKILFRYFYNPCISVAICFVFLVKGDVEKMCNYLSGLVGQKESKID